MYILAHKIISSIIIIVVLFISFSVYNNLTRTTGETHYVLSQVTKGTIVSSVTGSGQVSASNQIDLKARGTGEITYVGVSAGAVVKKGQTLFSLNAHDAQLAVQNAQTNLETVQLDLEKFKQPPDSVAVLQIKQAIANAETTKQDAIKAISDSYKTLLNTSVTAVPSDPSSTQTPPTISGTYTKGKEIVITINVYQTGNGAYFNAYSVPSDIVNGMGIISTGTPQPIGDSGLYIKFATTSSSQPNWIITLPNKLAANYNANLTAYQDAQDNQKKVNDTADLTIAQNNKNLNDLYQPDALTLRTKQLAVTQAENALQNAKTALSDYYVIAPFDGIMASVTGKLGDNTATSSAGTILGTIITKQQIATVSLNEVDIAKIQLGQKVTLTFDAVPNLTVTGKVAEIDSIGTVSQGVVNYNVKISLDTNDKGVKPGMSVNAAIITNVRQDVLTVPNSAIKNQSGTSYVEMFDTPLASPLPGIQGSPSTVPPTQQIVTIGSSDSTSTEIVSGLNEGDLIVTRTILPTTAKTTTTAPSLLGTPGGNSRGGGGMRIGG